MLIAVSSQQASSPCQQFQPSLPRPLRLRSDSLPPPTSIGRLPHLRDHLGTSKRLLPRVPLRRRFSATPPSHRLLRGSPPKIDPFNHPSHWSSARPCARRSPSPASRPGSSPPASTAAASTPSPISPAPSRATRVSTSALSARLSARPDEIACLAFQARRGRHRTTTRRPCQPHGRPGAARLARRPSSLPPTSPARRCLIASLVLVAGCPPGL